MWPRPLYDKETDLQALRREAEAGNWDGCCDSTARLLSRLRVRPAWELAWKHVADRLPVFERHQPGVTWPRELLMTLQGAGPFGGRFPEQPYEREQPGAYMFIQALRELWSARGTEADELKFSDYLADAIMVATAAQLMEDWGPRYPDLWKRWLQESTEEEEGEDFQRLLQEMLYGPESRRLGREVWLALAGLLEEAVLRPGGSPEAELLALRQSAEDGDTADYREALTRLLRRLPARQAFEVARQQVLARLPGFERHHPGVPWPRAFLVAMGQTRLPDGLVWSDDYDFDGPGGDTFVEGVRDLWQARHLVDDEGKRIEALLDAMAHAISAELKETWGSLHPERWKRWYHESTREEKSPDHGQIRDEMLLGPEARKLRCKLRLEVADVLEKALCHPAGTAP